MILEADIKSKILAHAKEDFPKESCGLIAVVKGRNRYFPCKNIATTPSEHFVLDPDDYIAAEEKGQVVSVVHSHPKTNHAPSPADRVACEKSGLTWHVVNPQTELWGYCEPEGFELEYVGRDFSHGIVDCYGLVRDFYKREFDIALRDYERRDGWWNNGQNLYLDNFGNEGFSVIDLEQIKYGDLILMCLEAPVPNHCAVYIGEGQVLHHVMHRLSSRDVYGGYYQRATAKILRHESR